MNDSRNFMQAVFDALRASESLLTVQDLCRRTRLSDGAVRGALERLVRLRCLTTVCQERIWRYGLRPSAQRPRDNRGKKPSKETA